MYYKNHELQKWSSGFWGRFIS